MSGISAAVIVASVLSVAVRTDSPSSSTLQNLALLLLFATPTLGIIALTSRWWIGPLECVLGVVGWAPRFRDLDCTDCAFAVLLPLNLVLAEAFFVLLALIHPTLRDPDRRP